MITKVGFLSGCLLILFAPLLMGQKEAEIAEIYAKRIKSEVINGVYIPVDLEDAHNELSRLADPAGLASFKRAPEDEVAQKLHFGLGRWILTNWGMEDGSRITHYFKLKGVPLPDDIVRIIIVTWHRKINRRPMLVLEEITAAKKRMEESKAKRDADKKVITVETRPHKE